MSQQYTVVRLTVLVSVTLAVAVCTIVIVVLWLCMTVVMHPIVAVCLGLHVVGVMLSVVMRWGMLEVVVCVVVTRCATVVFTSSPAELLLLGL